MNIKLSDLTLEEKVGQMLMFAFHGTTFNDQLKTQLDKFHIGGVIHFARNIIDPIQVTQLNKYIIKNSKIPPFIGIDQEGGVVQRIIKDVTPFPGAMALSATQKDIKKLCFYVGNNLRNMNYNMVFAPVADVNNNPLNPVINSRSYSDDPAVVSKYVNMAVAGFKDAKIMPFLKHFPGHGDTNVDSHVGLPFVRKTKEELKRTELVPFVSAVNNGAPGIMVAHIMYPAYDDNYPSTLSKAIVDDLLKEEIGFKGLTITDSLTMAAIYNNYSKKEIVTLSANAGVDIMMFCGKATLEEQEEIYNSLLNAVKDGIVPISRVDDAVSKILEYKEKYCDEVYDEYLLPSDDAVSLGKKLSRESITIVKDNKIDLKKKTLVVFPKIKLFSLVDNSDESYVSIGTILKKRGYKVDEVIIDSSDNNLDIDFIKNAKDYDNIIMATYNIQKDDYQVEVFNSLPKNKVTVVAMRSPYDILFLDDVWGYICIYEATELAINSLCDCLIENKYFGKLPISLKR